MKESGEVFATAFVTNSQSTVAGEPGDCAFDFPPVPTKSVIAFDPAPGDTRKDSWCCGVNPAHEHNRSGSEKRVASPISATKIAARIGPTPGNAWLAR